MMTVNGKDQVLESSVTAVRSPVGGDATVPTQNQSAAGAGGAAAGSLTDPKTRRGLVIGICVVVSVLVVVLLLKSRS